MSKTKRQIDHTLYVMGGDLPYKPEQPYLGLAILILGSVALGFGFIIGQL